MLTGAGDQSSRGGSPRQSVSVGFDGAAGDLGQQGGATVERGDGDRRIDGALVAAARLADQMQAALGARHRRRIPHRGLEQDVGGAVADLGGAGAHHAADGGGRDVVDDQHVAGIERAVDVVEGDDRLPRFGEPDVEAAGDQAAVVGVHRVPESRASRSSSRRPPARWP